MKTLEILMIYVSNYDVLLMWLLMAAVFIYLVGDRVEFLFKGMKELAARRNKVMGRCNKADEIAEVQLYDPNKEYAAGDVVEAGGKRFKCHQIRALCQATIVGVCVKSAKPECVFDCFCFPHFGGKKEMCFVDVEKMK